MPEEGPMEPKCCMKLWSCVHSKIDSSIPSQILSYSVPAQSLAERSVVQDSDYIPQTKETTKHVTRALCSTAVMTDPEGQYLAVQSKMILCYTVSTVTCSSCSRAIIKEQSICFVITATYLHHGDVMVLMLKRQYM